MELTETELILHTRRRDAVKWPYLCLRRYGYDSNLFSFESGRRCQTGQGIFAFKCARAEEIFNMLQEIMQNNSISVVEEPVMERNHNQTDADVPRTPRTPTTPGFVSPSLPNGCRYPSFGDTSSRPSSRHPSVGSARLPSVGEESTHPLLVADEPVHTYVNTTGVQEERRSRSSDHAPLELRLSNPESLASGPLASPDDTEPQVLLEPEAVKFILGPTPVQRQLMEKEKQEKPDPEPDGGGVVHEAPVPVGSVNGGPSKEEEDGFGPKTPSLNGYHHNLDPMHNYVNTENVTVPLSAHKLDSVRRRDCTPTVFNFDFRRSSLEHRQLNYIEVEMERGSDSDNPQTPKTPTTPLPQTPTRRTELYAVIDIERTAAMSSLQKALPRDDGTSRKTRHNSTDLPM
ncbi:FRS2 factor, partial [Amia calva]|nr:FRS2 factor [Amia calva]